MERRLFRDVPERNWKDPAWQLRHRIRDGAALARLLPGLFTGAGEADRVSPAYPFAVTPYYLSLIDPESKEDPIALQCLPREEELRHSPGVGEDPLNEEGSMPVPGLIRRYADRCLLLATGECAVLCRHCNRKRNWKARRKRMTWREFDAAAAFIEGDRSIREVILSGGDPLTLDRGSLRRILQTLKAIPHVRMLRIGTRIPAVLPMAVDGGLLELLREFRPLWIATQFNHPRELTAEAAAACTALLERGIPVVNQSVLLRGVNDVPEVMRDLLYGLVEAGVKPYYLFHCEPVRGVEHFRVPPGEGSALFRKLRREISGIALPRFVYDLPGGKGKRSLESETGPGEGGDELSFDRKGQID